MGRGHPLLGPMGTRARTKRRNQAKRHQATTGSEKKKERKKTPLRPDLVGPCTCSPHPGGKWLERNSVNVQPSSAAGFLLLLPFSLLVIKRHLESWRPLQVEFRYSQRYRRTACWRARESLSLAYFAETFDAMTCCDNVAKALLTFESKFLNVSSGNQVLPTAFQRFLVIPVSFRLVFTFGFQKKGLF